MLVQEAVDAKANECADMLDLLARMSLDGALVTIGAIATNPTVEQANLDAGGNYVLALKKIQPSFQAEVASHFKDPATTGLETVEIIDKDHGRLETRRCTVSHDIDWLTAARRHPDEPRLPKLACLVKTTTRIERKGKVCEETRYFVSSAKLSAKQAATVDCSAMAGPGSRPSWTTAASV